MSEADDIIAKLRHEAIIGGGWASIHTSDIEAIATDIAGLRSTLDEMRQLAGLPPADEIGLHGYKGPVGPTVLKAGKLVVFKLMDD